MSFLLIMGQTAPLLANPTGGVVVAGAATIGSAGATLSINQSTGRAIINWQQFSIAGGETTKFIVPNSGATLNRVVGGNLSAIYGTLQSNGALYLINPSGILVGPSGRINTSSFMASTLDVSNEQFLAGGDLTLSGSNGTIDNEGIIHASGGDVYLIANQVTNNGTIKAPHGTVGLAAGSEVLYKQAGSQHLFIQSTPTGTKRALGVTNAGTIQAAAAELKAAGGNAYALAINNTGVIAATGYKKINGQVYLTSDGGSISNSGKISAKQANGNGGTIVVDGTATTSTTSGTVTNSGTLDASATAAGGSGGTVTVKNMGGTTVHSGTILAKGGQGGTGGNAEVSGGTLVFTGLVDLTASGGTTGTLLLDPAALDVVTGGTGQVVSGENDANSTTISPTTVENALSTANLVLNADTTLTISNAITWTSATTLTLSTNDSGSSSIVINAPISGVNGGLTIAAAGSDPITTGAAGSVDVASFILQSGTWNQVSATLPAFTASQNFALESGSTFLRATGGDGSSGTPYQITDVYGLQGVGSSGLSVDSFELVNNIDATGTSTWNSGAGFAPINNYFAGTFDGMTHTINGLYVNLPTDTYAALFGLVDNSNSVIKNVALTNVQISGDGYVGALVGFSVGATISNCYSTGTITTTSDSYFTGGLVGVNEGPLLNSYSSANVSGGNEEGGLVGINEGGTIDSCYSTGTVSGVDYVGGLVGYNYTGTISNCYSTSSVSGSYSVGGLVGLNVTSLSNSYSTGAVSGTDYVGGLIGETDGGTIADCFWDTDTAGVVLGVGTDSTNTTVGVTGATTAQLKMQATYPSTWDFTNTWSTFGNTLTPQLIGLPQTSLPTGGSTLDTLNGVEFLDSGLNPDMSGSTIDLIYNGMTQSTTANGAGSFSFSVNPSELIGGILLTDAADNGNTFFQTSSPGSVINGVDLWGNTLLVQAGSASNAALAAAAVNAPGVNYAVSGSNLTTNQGVNVNILSNYTLDGNITASGTGAITAGSGSVLSSNSNVTLMGSSVTLGGTIIGSGTPTIVSTASPTILGNIVADNLVLSGVGVTLGGTTVVNSLTINAGGGNISQVGSLTAGLLTIGNAGEITLTNPDNNITALGQINHTGALNLYTDPGLVISNSITGNAPVTITEVGGDIYFGPNGTIIDSGVGNNVVVASGTNLANSNHIINDSTVGAIQVSNGANFDLYSSDPAGDVFGGITVPAANMFYNASYLVNTLPAGNSEFFYEDNTPPASMLSTIIGGADDSGSNIVPPSLTPQITQVTQPTLSDIITAGSTPPAPFSFAGSGGTGSSGQQEGGLASSSGNSGQVGKGDAAQIGNGQLNNVANPYATGALNQALGPAVFHNLEQALQNAGDFTDASQSGSGGDASASEKETILQGGEMAEISNHGVKNIAANQAPDQLRVAMDSDVLNVQGGDH